MKAVLIDKITKAEEIFLSEVEMPKVKSSWVLVKIFAFGLNHSEKILRHGEILENYIEKPVIPGIECVGEIFDASDTNFKVGEKVVALMGGMGRNFNGSYAEFAILPAHHVFSVKSSLSWENLAAIPETFFTACGSLFECLRLKKNDEILIRGATCSLGYAAIQIAKNFGAKVVATTHKKEKFNLLEDADEKILDDGKLFGKISVDKVLDLVGAKVLRDSLKIVKPSENAFVCNTGILGGEEFLQNFDPITEIPNGVYLTGFYSNTPTQEIIDKIFEFIEAKKITPKVGAVFEFENIRDALIAQDFGKVNGKIVVKVR
mgnify:CR=1 FL=1